MRLTLAEPSDLEKGFTDKNDIFEYREFGEQLANLVSNIEEPLVITLDGAWGSGKSVFIKQWAGLIKKERHGSVVYFDAFKNDFHDDAFLALASEIYSLAKKTLGEDDSSTQTFLDSAKEVGKVLAPITLSVGVRNASAGFLNIEGDEASGILKAITKMFRKEQERPLEKAISEKLQAVDKEREALEAFRKALEDVSKAIAEKTKKPLIFIVDELDRCRPPFALDIIERIKHLFSVSNVCFVLVTHLPQLEKAIQGAYGTEFNAHTYLEKFYQLKVILPEPSEEHQNRRNKYLNHLWQSLKPKFEDSRYNELVHKEIRRLSNVYALELREIEHVLRNVILAAASARNNRIFNPIVISGLCIMRQTHSNLYARAQQNRLPWEEVEKFLQIESGRNDTNTTEREWVTRSWKVFTDPNAHRELPPEYFNHLHRYNIDDRLSVLSIFTDHIDSLAGDYTRE